MCYYVDTTVRKVSYLSISSSFPPKTFIPVLCNIFLDDTAPELILEPTTRALYFFLDISLDCGKKITSVSGTITKFIQIIESADIYIKESLDLGEQCVKVIIDLPIVSCIPNTLIFLVTIPHLDPRPVVTRRQQECV